MNVRKKKKCFEHTDSQGQELNPHYDLAPPPPPLAAGMGVSVSA